MYCVVDLETTSKEVYKRKGNPFYNRILCYGLKYQPVEHECIEWDGLKIKPGDKEMEACLCFTKYAAKDYLPKGWLDGVTVLVGHNIKYDLLYLWRDEELQEAFKRGLMVYDTALAEFILTGQQHKYPKLRDIAVYKYSCEYREKHIEKYFKEGKDLSEGDIKLLLIDVRNDVLDTEQVVLKQAKLAKNAGQWKLILAHGDSTCLLTEIEYNGMYINQQKLQENKTNLQKELASIDIQIMKIVEKYWK